MNKFVFNFLKLELYLQQIFARFPNQGAAVVVVVVVVVAVVAAVVVQFVVHVLVVVVLAELALVWSVLVSKLTESLPIRLSSQIRIVRLKFLSR